MQISNIFLLYTKVLIYSEKYSIFAKKLINSRKYNCISIKIKNDYDRKT